MTFTTILNFINTFSALRAAVIGFVAFFVKQEIAAMKTEDRDVIRKAVLEQDQRDLERTLGNPHAGEASRAPGSVVVGTLPGVGL